MAVDLQDRHQRRSFQTELTQLLWQNQCAHFLPRDAGWCDGGCLILAEALLAYLPGAFGHMLVRRGGDVMDHAFVVWQGWAIDGDGICRPRTLQRRWERILYRYDVRPLDPAVMSRDAPRNHRGSQALAELLEECLGEPDVWTVELQLEAQAA